jgi:hypothetical protein
MVKEPQPVCIHSSFGKRFEIAGTRKLEQVISTGVHSIITIIHNKAGQFLQHDNSRTNEGAALEMEANTMGFAVPNTTTSIAVPNITGSADPNILSNH